MKGMDTGKARRVWQRALEDRRKLWGRVPRVAAAVVTYNELTS